MKLAMSRDTARSKPTRVHIRIYVYTPLLQPIPTRIRETTRAKFRTENFKTSVLQKILDQIIHLL